MHISLSFVKQYLYTIYIYINFYFENMRVSFLKRTKHFLFHSLELFFLFLNLSYFYASLHNLTNEKSKKKKNKFSSLCVHRIEQKKSIEKFLKCKSCFNY